MLTDLDTSLTLPSGLEVPNRIAKAPMTENLADRRNQPTVRHERVYRRWARGGAGLLVTGNLMVDRRYLERSRNIVADAALDVSALSRVVEATGETPILAQLSHPGRQCARWIARTPVGPSRTEAVKVLGGFGRPRELAGAEVRAIVESFGDAAQRCRAAGMDGVQVHAAHGYLLAQFLSPLTNRRTDEYGGDLAGRARPLLDAVAAVRAATADDFTVAVKLNSSDFRHGGFSAEDAVSVVSLLADAGVDLVEVSGGTYESPALLGLADSQRQGQDGETGTESGSPYREAYFAEFATRARAAAPDLPIMLTGGLRTAAAMRSLLASGAVDLIGLARPLALDPELARKLLDGGEGIELPAYRVPKLLAMAGESEWYETQIARLADGREPDPDLNPVRAATGFVGGEMTRGLREGRPRRALAATAASAGPRP